jgi:predicted enzyme related to lactoylglutathione lyase
MPASNSVMFRYSLLSLGAFLMVNNIKLLVYPVKDVERAKAFFGRFLSVEPYVDSAYYVGFKVGDLEIGLDPNAKAGPIAYIDVEDIKRSLQSLAGAGAEVIQDAKEVGGGLLIAQVKTSDGNIFGLRQETK